MMDLREPGPRRHDEVRMMTLLVTHDQEEAMDLADHIVVMNRGAVEQEGDAALDLRRPDDALRRELHRFLQQPRRATSQAAEPSSKGTTSTGHCPPPTPHPRRRSEERRVGKECRARW